MGESPARLAHGHLVAVVSRVPEDDFAEKPLRRRPEDLDRLTGTAHAHERVVDATPLRLATVFRDDSGVRTMLEEGETRFRHVLERIAGRDHLRQRRRAALSGEESWHRAELFSARLRSVLCSPADAACLRPPRNSPASPTEQNVFNAAFLVRREFSASFMEIADGSWTSSGST